MDGQQKFPANFSEIGKEKGRIAITITETAKIELFKVLRHFGPKSVRLIQQGFG